ncbi:hypothetical protein ACE6ED_17540 [Paenibacillus sp. CN-4]|uniref:hypothetical protein n=1 Tax=Paenibacillus nanchangensis TaxID=3348343 RepID=UPI003979D35C
MKFGYGRKGRTWLSGLLAAVLLLGIFPTAGQAEPSGAAGSGTDYYVDSRAGSDSNTGTQESKP